MFNAGFASYLPSNCSLKLNPVKNNPNNSGKKACLHTISNSISFGNNYTFPNLNTEYIETNKGYIIAPTVSEIREKVDALDLYALWNELNKENEQKQYIKFQERRVENSPVMRLELERKEIYKTSPEARVMLQKLDSMDEHGKRAFIRLFCDETGFPSLETVTEKMESEILNGAHKLADDNNSAVKFIGYDSNCSMGRKCALPGKDCDGLFVIIEPPKDAPEWLAPCMRWNLKDMIRQRIVSTPSNHLPEVLTTDYIEQGLNIASELFDEANFTEEDLTRFLDNINDDSKDFVKTAEFDIRLAKMLPPDKAIRDKFYKTAMFVEVIRGGRILENQFSSEFMEKIKSSPLYKYSNIMKQQGFKDCKKQKHVLRTKMVEQFIQGSSEEQYEIIRDILHSSLSIKDVRNKEFFTNESKNGADEMGNILEMYDLLKNATV